jgi:hypothetical protein
MGILELLGQRDLWVGRLKLRFSRLLSLMRLSSMKLSGLKLKLGDRLALVLLVRLLLHRTCLDGTCVGRTG